MGWLVGFFFLFILNFFVFGWMEWEDGGDGIFFILGFW